MVDNPDLAEPVDEIPPDEAEEDSLPEEETDTSQTPQASDLIGVMSEMTAQMRIFNERFNAMAVLPAAGPSSAPVEPTPTQAQSPAPARGDKTAQNLPAAGAATTPSSLRTDEHLMANVARRLLTLGVDNTDDEDDTGNTASAPKRKGKRSGQARTVEDLVIRVIDWPHLNVYRGPERRPVRYNELTLPEFVHGYLQMIRNPKNGFDQDIMMQILSDMMEDALSYSWDHVRNFYRVLASHIEMEKIAWTDSSRISGLRYHYAHRHGPMAVQPTRATGRSVPTSSRVCFAFQRGECSETGDHGGYLHACSHCVRARGVAHAHPEKDCRQKAKDPKFV